MKETKNVPQLRFSGFDDEWENKEFSELFERRMERNNGQFGYDRWISVAKMYFQKPDKVTSNNIDTRTYVMRKSDIAFEGHSNKDYKLGRFVENDIGDGVISELFPIYKHIASYDLNYWKYAIQIERIMFPKLTKCIEISYTSSNKLDEYFFLKEHVLVPSCSEQKKIGTFLSHVDSLIQAKTKKLESLNAVKKSLLQKCFPKAGEKVPEMRFAGFSGEWEEKKLGEIAEKIMVGIANSATYAYADKGIVMFRNQNIKPNYLDEDDLIYLQPSFELTYKNKRLKENDVLVARTGYPGTACVVPKKYENSQTFTTLILRLKQDILEPYYVTQYLNSPIGITYFTSTQIGGGQKNSGASILSDMPFRYPSITEQQKIGQFFSKYDVLISAQQKEIDKLKDIKKSLLQKMFV